MRQRIRISRRSAHGALLLLVGLLGFGGGLLAAPQVRLDVSVLPTPTGLPTPTTVSTPTPTSLPAPTSTTEAATQPGGQAPAQQGNTGFHETFDGEPGSPLAYRSPKWDVTVHSRDVDTWLELEPMQAQHGPDCGPPTSTHTVTQYADAVFLCRNHLMTAINAEGYGVIYLTPNQQVDFSQGEAVIAWDMSTLRTSGRDWIDVWITPYDHHIQAPLEDWLPDLSGPPQDAIHVRMDFNQNVFYAVRYEAFVARTIQDANPTLAYDAFLTPDPARRDRFELRISAERLIFGMPEYDVWWIDAPLSDLDWRQGIVQFGHHSYSPTKDCTGPCGPNTWHWDNFRITPAAPFTMIAADRRYLDADNDQAHFASPAPANAHLRFSGIGAQLELSFDDGRTWQPAQEQIQNPAALDAGGFRSYWTSIPAGTATVRVRGTDWWGGGWHIRDLAIWAQP